MGVWEGREGRENGSVRTSGGYVGGRTMRKGGPRTDGCGCCWRYCNYFPCAALALSV